MGAIQKVNQKHISILLGIFWLIDSIFQMQPKMFTSEFANKVIEPFSLNQPAFLSYLMHHVINLVLINPIFFQYNFYNYSAKYCNFNFKSKNYKHRA